MRDEQPDFTVIWDGEAKQWIALGDYIKGLVIEADTLTELGSRLEVIIPELMKANEQELRPLIVSAHESPPPMKSDDAKTDIEAARKRAAWLVWRTECVNPEDLALARAFQSIDEAAGAAHAALRACEKAAYAEGAQGAINCVVEIARAALATLEVAGIGRKRDGG